MCISYKPTIGKNQLLAVTEAARAAAIAALDGNNDNNDNDTMHQTWDWPLPTSNDDDLSKTVSSKTDGDGRVQTATRATAVSTMRTRSPKTPIKRQQNNTTKAAEEEPKPNDIVSSGPPSSAPKNKHQRQQVHRCHQVEHHYHDHAEDVISEEMKVPPVYRGCVRQPFPFKLHTMLDTIEKDGYVSVISWQPHGRCFVVHDPAAFVKTVMPKYFNQSKFSSFQRQLNLYGFNRITQGPDKGGYYHEMFLRGKLPFARRIARKRVKGTCVRGKSSPDTEPNFYAMPFIGRDGEVLKTESDTTGTSTDTAPHVDAEVDTDTVEESRRDTVAPDQDEQDARVASVSIDGSDNSTEPDTSAAEEAAAAAAAASSEMDTEPIPIADFGFGDGMDFDCVARNVYYNNNNNNKNYIDNIDCVDNDDDISTIGEFDESTDNNEDGDDYACLMETIKIPKSLYNYVASTIDDDHHFGDVVQALIE